MRGSLHPATATLSVGILRLCCLQLINQLVGEDLSKRYCGKANFTPFAYPYKGDSTAIISNVDVHKIMGEYLHFLEHVFDAVWECSQAVLSQVTSLSGWKEAFRVYEKEHPFAFFSLPITMLYEIKTSCHPKFFLNKMYKNEHTENHASSLVILTHASRASISSRG